MRIPERIGWLRSLPGGSGWLDGLPTTVEACVDAWGLSLDEPFEDSFVSWVAPGRSADGTGVVLKVQYPHGEAEFEADALAAWDGNGAVQILAHDRDHHALLLERCVPGTHLSSIGPDDAIGVLIDVLPRLWVEAGGPFRSVADEAQDWIDDLPTRWQRAERPFPERLVDAAIESLGELLADVEATVLVHQDLHGDNVLAAEREPWLAIDPKPLLADRE
ncbi:MAG: phosphotransferase, partial [Acidimicrobiia bacterium]|nr:phosphotransferase [Acidimicrobiia bacterium]